MSMELRLPNITGKTPEEQLSQLKNYLYTTIEQMNWALSVTEKASDELSKKVEKVVDESSAEKKAESTFGEIKSLIIKDADIVSAYREEITKEYDGKYVAVSDMGTYEENIKSSITEGPDGINIQLKSLKEITDTLSSDAVRQSEGYIKIGKIGEKDGADVYGVEIGQNLASDSDRKLFSRYTAEGTTLYNANGDETIVIAAGKTRFSGNVTVDELTVDNFSLNRSNGLGLYWEGGEN